MSSTGSYFEFLKELDDKRNSQVYKTTSKALLNRVLKQEELHSETKSDLAVAVALAFARDFGGEAWDSGLLEIAASLIWEGMNTEIGERIDRDGIKGKLRFYWREGCCDPAHPTSAAAVESKALLDRILRVPFQSKTVDEMVRLVESYTRSDLTGGDSLRLVQEILKALDTPEKRKQFSDVFSSVSGPILYQNMKQQDETGRQYADLMIAWYSQHATLGWKSPLFLSWVGGDYPDLKPRVQRILSTISPDKVTADE
jgi:hypothetical protein